MEWLGSDPSALLNPGTSLHSCSSSIPLPPRVLDEEGENAVSGPYPVLEPLELLPHVPTHPASQPCVTVWAVSMVLQGCVWSCRSLYVNTPTLVVGVTWGLYSVPVRNTRVPIQVYLLEVAIPFYGMNCAPPNSYVETLSPQCDYIGS